VDAAVAPWLWPPVFGRPGVSPGRGPDRRQRRQWRSDSRDLPACLRRVNLRRTAALALGQPGLARLPEAGQPQADGGAGAWTAGTAVLPYDDGHGRPGVLAWPRSTVRPDRVAWNKPLHGFRVSRRKLPHWQEVGRLYFVTFRTAGLELPAAARDIVLRACLNLHGTMIDLYGVVVMPDHVHLLLQPLPVKQDVGNPLDPAVHDLGRVAHAIKSFSAHEINHTLGRRGKLWRPERFDRIVRDEGEYREKLQYMLNNPVKKGLVADPYAYLWLAFPEAPSR